MRVWEGCFGAGEERGGGPADGRTVTCTRGKWLIRYRRIIDGGCGRYFCVCWCLHASCRRGHDAAELRGTPVGFVLLLSNCGRCASTGFVATTTQCRRAGATPPSFSGNCEMRDKRFPENSLTPLFHDTQRTTRERWRCC